MRSEGGIFLKKTILTYLLLCVVLFLCPSLSAYADSSLDTLWYNVFGNPYDASVMGGYENTPPVYYPSNVPEGYDYCFCAGSAWSGKAIFTDSPTLVCSMVANNPYYLSLTVPSGYHIIFYSYNITGTYPNASGTNWTAGGNGAFTGTGGNPSYGPQIWRNDCTIVDSQGNEIAPPLVDDKFNFKLTAYTDYSIKGESWFVGSERDFRVKYYIVPAVDSDVADLAVDTCFDLLSAISVANENHDTSTVERLEQAFQQQYPLVYEAMNIAGETVVKIVDTIQSMALEVPSESNPLIDAFLKVNDLQNEEYYVTTNSYHNWRGFGGGYIYADQINSFDLNVLSFYSSVRNLPNYSDLNAVYCCFYSTTTDASYCFLSRTFRVSDFMPTIVLPNLNVPSPDVIDGLPSLPPDSTTDWTIYQHAMYMQYLLSQLDTNFKISITDFGDSFRLPDYEYTYDVEDLEPYDYDLTVPDVSAPDGVPLELARPVSFLGSLWSSVLDSTGLSIIIPWCMIIGLVAWFFYGKG